MADHDHVIRLWDTTTQQQLGKGRADALVDSMAFSRALARDVCHGYRGELRQRYATARRSSSARSA